MMKKFYVFLLTLLVFSVTAVSAFADFSFNFGSDFYFGLDNFDTSLADGYMANYTSAASASAASGWTVDTTNNVVLPDTHKYTSNGDGTSSVTQKTNADFSKYDEDEIVKPFKYPDDSTAVRIEFTLDGDNDKILNIVGGKEHTSLDVDPYDNKIYDVYDFDGKPGGKYARKQVGERVVMGWPGYGYVYESALYAVAGYPTDSSATSNTTTDIQTTTAAADLTVPADKTPVTVNPETGKVYHDPSGVVVKEAHYSAADKKIYYVDNGTVTIGTYGTMLTETTGYISTDPASFALQYPESVVADENDAVTGAADDAADAAGDSATDSVAVNYDSNNFKDVPDWEWYYEPVWYAAAAGWIKYDGNFRPNEPMSRCEFAKVLLIAHEVDVDNDFSANFSDVDAGHWGAPFVYAGLKLGLWAGVGGGKFGCDNPITREQAAKMIANAIGMQATDEDDFAPSDGYADWSLPYIRRMHKTGFMTDKNGAFDAGGNFTRAQAMKVFYRIFKPPY